MTGKGTVYLVGAGPGHPGLLTLRAVECLQRAHFVLYDKLVPAAFVDLAPASAEKLCVGDLSPSESQRHLPIHETMIAAARAGKTVVRLKEGDPCLFGRGGEEAQSLRRAGIPFEIVPGVTAGLGAAAYAGIPLTHRNHAGAVALVTGHENPEKPESAVDWAALARFPGTIVVYMGMSRLDKIVQALVEHGKEAGTLAAAVHWAGTGEQRTVQAALVDLAASVRKAGLGPPAVVIIGSVVSLRDEVNWFEKLPLFGKRVLVTRPIQQARDMAHRLVELGAVPVTLPAVAISAPKDYRPVDDAINRLASYRWLVFTSANGVHYFLRRLRTIGLDLRALGQIRIAVIGPQTAEALRQYHLEADLMPPVYQSEHLAEALKARVLPGERVLLARADRGRELLREELAKCCDVTETAVYSQQDAVDASSPALDQLRRGEIDFILLSSTNIARALFRSLDGTGRARLEQSETRLVSISPVTSAEIRAAGFPVAAEARQATSDGLIEALRELAERGAAPAGAPLGAAAPLGVAAPGEISAGP